MMNNSLSPSRFRLTVSAMTPDKVCPRNQMFSSQLRRFHLPPSLPSRERSKATLTVGQAVALAILCSSLAAIMTASSAVYYSDSILEMEHALSSRSLFDRGARGEEFNLRRSLPPNTVVSGVPMQGNGALPRRQVPQQPKVAWLMSFPNSGTSFTIHMTREASNATTATNYALEGDIRNKPSVPVFAGREGEQGPWLELIPNRETHVPGRYILTKTHCKGFCTGRYCGAEKTIHTVRSFRTGCLSGTRAVHTKRGLEKVDVTYSAQLVGKAIHIFRHPLDNVVARFHLEFNVQEAKGNTKFTDMFTKDETGFKRWCMLDDSNRGLLSHRLIDQRLRRLMEDLPCFNEFYRYIQWHNLAFAVSHDMNLPTMILHYYEYSQDFEATRDKVLDWLELPRVANGVKFQVGKIYRSYYTPEEKLAIREFLHEFASAETWGQLKDYDFASDDSPTFNATAAVELSMVL